jgi:Tfp pilus assembly protein PilW
MSARPSFQAAARRGLSIVELLVGVAVGLFVVAAATVLVSGQLGENRRLLLESQLQQDLRATSDIIARELRRSGSNLKDFELVATPASAATRNTLAPATAASSGNQIDFRYQRSIFVDPEVGFRLQAGVIQTNLVSSDPARPSGWQDLTDRNVVNVTAFTVTSTQDPTQEVPCPTLCPGGGTACWPQVNVREFMVEISAQLTNAPEVRRSVRSRVRARNDEILFRYPTAASAARACPP